MNINSLTSFVSKYQRGLAFFLILTEFLIYQYNARWPDRILWDAWFYFYALASKIFTQEGFSLLTPDWRHFDWAPRPYFFATVLSFCWKIASIINVDVLKVLHFANSLFFAWISVYFLPTFAKILFKLEDNYKPNIISYFILAQFLLIFWGGYLLTSLSDFPAVILYFVAIYFIIRLIDSSKFITLIKYAILAGLFFGFSYSTRTINLFGFYLAIIYVIIIGLLDKRYKFLIFQVFFIIIGFIVAQLPQLYINIMKYNDFNLLLGGGDATLILLVLEGQGVLDYNTYFYGTSVHSAAASSLIMKQKVSSQLGYIYNTLTNFSYFLEITISKIFQSINISYNDAYVLDLFDENIWLRNFNYILWCLGFVSLYLLRLTFRNILLILLVIFPACLAYMGHVEYRYFIHLYLLMYLLVSFVLVYRFKLFVAFFKESKSRVYYTVVLSLLFILFMNGFTNYIKSLSSVQLLFPPQASNIFESKSVSSAASYPASFSANRSYKVSFKVKNPFSCDKVLVSMSAGDKKIEHLRLPEFFRYNYYVIFKPTETGIGNITLTYDEKKCEVYDFSIKQ